MNRQEALTQYAKNKDLSGANLSGADLSEADLSGANLRGAKLSGADLRGAKLRGAKLSEADLSWAELSGADLHGAKLSGADLRGAKLRGAKLSWAELSGADLSEAELRGANLRGAKLSGADLRGAKLRGANFGVPLQDQIERLDAVRAIVVAKPERLYMAEWHRGGWTPEHTPEEEQSCGSAHCIAGWLQALSPDPVIRQLDALQAGIQLAPIAASQFYDDDDSVLDWFRKREYANG